nr:hypothetical protein [Rhizobium leguminosarum]
MAVKRLSAVEANVLRSNQHEFNSSTQLKSLLGMPDRVKYQAIFIWIGGEQEALSEEGFLTWYQSRKPPRREHRLYFPTNAVCEAAAEGDVLFIARRTDITDNTLMAIIVPGGSTIQNQLLWLFGLEEQPALQFESLEISIDNAAELDFTARYILDELGIEVEEPEADRLDTLVEKFGLVFPPTRVLSELARTSLPQASAAEEGSPAGRVTSVLMRRGEHFAEIVNGIWRIPAMGDRMAIRAKRGQVRSRIDDVIFSEVRNGRHMMNLYQTGSSGAVALSHIQLASLAGIAVNSESGGTIATVPFVAIDLDADPCALREA